MRRVFFIDFEASSLLPGSFPIEVAWVDQHGVGESHLIRPAADWMSEDGAEWDAVSEDVHGISLETLLRDGEDAGVVARRLVQAIGAAPAYSDATGYDGAWLETLLDEGGQSGAVRLCSVLEAYSSACQPLFDRLPKKPGLVRNALQAMQVLRARHLVDAAVAAEAHSPRIHRALPDAVAMWRTWNDIGCRVEDVVRREKQTFREADD